LKLYHLILFQRLSFEMSEVSKNYMYEFQSII
jgi:hypothetical protein